MDDGFFAFGTTCFLIGRLPGYANLVGDAADSVTFLVGSVSLTAGGALQAGYPGPAANRPAPDRAAVERTGAVAGALFFNLTTLRVKQGRGPHHMWVMTSDQHRR